MHVNKLYGLLFLLVVLGCTGDSEIEDLGISNIDANYAIPLINIKANILDVESETGSNTAILKDEEGRLTLKYQGNVLRRGTGDIFPPVPGVVIGIQEMLDTVTSYTVDELVPIEGGLVLQKARFQNTRIQFRLRSDAHSNVKVQILIPKIVDSEGRSFVHKVDLLNKGEEILTDFVSLHDMTLITDDNDVQVIYRAYDSDGNRIYLDDPAFAFDLVFFSYVEGFFTKDNNPEIGNIITVGLYTNWISGGIAFNDPKLAIVTENSFGFPVRGVFNMLTITDIKGESFELTGPPIDNGIDFEYPSLDMVGAVLEQRFEFNKDNSNIGQVFEEKVASITYDVNAISNPDDDNTIIGFLTSDSYYNVDIALELPLELRMNDLILADTFEVDLNSLNDITAAEFKMVATNNYPFNTILQTYFIDENNVVLDSLFTELGYELPSASVDGAEILENHEVTTISNFDQPRFETIKNAKKIGVKIRFWEEDDGLGKTWLYDTQNVEFKLGAILNVKR